MNESFEQYPTPSLCSGRAGGKNLFPQEVDSSAPCPLHPCTAVGTANSNLCCFPFLFASLQQERGSDPLQKPDLQLCQAPQFLPPSPAQCSSWAAIILAGRTSNFAFPKVADRGFACTPVMAALALLLPWVRCRTPAQLG